MCPSPRCSRSRLRACQRRRCAGCGQGSAACAAYSTRPPRSHAAAASRARPAASTIAAEVIRVPQSRRSAPSTASRRAARMVRIGDLPGPRDGRADQRYGVVKETGRDHLRRHRPQRQHAARSSSSDAPSDRVAHTRSAARAQNRRRSRSAPGAEHIARAIDGCMRPRHSSRGDQCCANDQRRTGRWLTSRGRSDTAPGGARCRSDPPPRCGGAHYRPSLSRPQPGLAPHRPQCGMPMSEEAERGGGHPCSPARRGGEGDLRACGQRANDNRRTSREYPTLRLHEPLRLL